MTSRLHKNARDTRCVRFCKRSGCRILDVGLPCLLSVREGSPNGISLDGTGFSRIGMIETFITVTATSAAPRADQFEAALNINEHNGPTMVLGLVDENRGKSMWTPNGLGMLDRRWTWCPRECPCLASLLRDASRSLSSGAHSRDPVAMLLKDEVSIRFLEG
jgi:hypothetical protein